jgi:HSP20 family molecular chaperone IbpA
MAAMRAVGYRPQLPLHANVRETYEEYVIELDVSDFTRAELSVEALGPAITVRGDQQVVPGDEGKAFQIHERLEESFRLLDDADPDRIDVYFSTAALEIHVQRMHLEPRRCRSSAVGRASSSTRRRRRLRGGVVALKTRRRIR